MNPEEVATFVADNVEPLKDAVLGNRYRVAAHLKDGTYLPCVILQSKQKQIELALRRFKQLRWRRSQYRAVVESFVCAGSRVADDQLKNVELSPFAWPIELLRNIHRETTTRWTAFVAEMNDGTMHSYGASFMFEFFELPEGYSHSSITKIHSGFVYSKTGGLEKFSIEALKKMQPYREMPFFTSYLQALDDSG
jgi:hypothetical protein